MKLRSAAALMVGAILVVVSSLGAETWQPLSDDGLHDSSNPYLEILQEPAEALIVLQPDTAGNKVNWVKALQNREINPRSSLSGDIDPEILDLDIVMTRTLPLPNVIFPHRPHTEWMSCETCHEDLFVSETGANSINMGQILQGEYCGLCHGAVSFPLTECNRCHNVRRENIIMAPASGAIREREQ
jgi:c(7)-type cytochrome triheme protein